MQKLEIHRHIEDVFDIAAADLDPKPLPQVYQRFLSRHAVDAAKAGALLSAKTIKPKPECANCRFMRVSPGRKLSPLGAA